MMRKFILLPALGMVLIGLVYFGAYWFSTQPIWIVNGKVNNETLHSIPPKNKQVINFIETNGRKMAPSYDEVVCTEFVIKVIDKFDKLTKDEKDDIRIIANQNLNDLIKNESSIIRGVQTALTKRDKGIEIRNSEDVRPGDFVQLWNVYQGRECGHCGVILDIDPNRSITLFSSHPLTNGYGKQKYLWQDKVFFVRLK